MSKRIFLSLCLGLVTAAAGVAVAPQQASACGGFFCNSSQPVNQAAERVIFSDNGDGTVTMAIEVQYAGPAESFAWVLPVNGLPEVGVSSNVVFQRLQAMTNPQYTLNTIVEGTCREGALFGGGPRGSVDSSASDAGAPAPMDSGVTVVGEGSVGPFDWVTISLDPEDAEAADVAVDWLQTNGFDIDDLGRERLGPYLDAGMNLIAFRLTKGNDAGAIRPIVMTFESDRPMIPMRPTAVAAQPDMGVMVWVLGEARAIPANYLHLHLNDAAIDWLQPNRNYNDVVTAAADESGGQGFVTEMAGSRADLGDLLNEWEDGQLDESRTAELSDGQLLNEVLGNFGAWDGMREVVEAHVTLPADVTVDQLLSCVSCYVEWGAVALPGFDREGFLTAVDSDVLGPVREMQTLFDARPYVTRLYTTLSAEEMTLDPVFDFNPELGDYSNQHIADRIIECHPSVEQSEAPWRVVLPTGEIVRGTGRSWPFDVDAADPMPATAVAERITTSGQGETVMDNSSEITARIREHNPTVPTVGGCSASGGGAGSGYLGGALLALGLTVMSRRRRRG